MKVGKREERKEEGEVGKCKSTECLLDAKLTVSVVPGDSRRSLHH